MAGKMAPLKKPQNIPRVPLALNPLKSKDVLAVLAERNQAIVPIGAWVEPASPHCSEIPANTSACVIEEELKEQLRKKKETLKHFQRQVKRRVNQHIRLRKKQQLQKSYEAAEKEGSIAIQSSDPVLRGGGPKKRTSVFTNTMNAASGISWLPLTPEDGENHNELFQQQAQALSQTMKQVRHQLASFKTMGENKSSVLPDGKLSVPIQEPASIRINIETREEFTLKAHQGLSATVHYQNFMQNQKLDSVGCVSIMTDEKWRENLLWGDQQDLLSEIKDKPFNRVQKVQFKNPLFDVMEEKELKQLHFQDMLSEAQDYLQEVQSDLSETLGVLPRVQSAESEAQNLEPDTQAFDLEVPAGELKTQSDEPETQVDEVETQADELENQTGEPRAQAAETKAHGVMLKAQSIELEEGSIMMEEAQDFLPEIQGVQPKDQDFLLKDEDVLHRDQNILPKCQDQDIVPKYQKVNLKQPASISILIGRGEREVFPLDVKPDLHRHQDQASIRYKKVRFKEPHCAIMDGSGEEDFSLADSKYLPPKLQEQTFIRDQQSSSFMREETVRQESPQENHQYVIPKIQDQASPGEQVYDTYQSGLNTEIQDPMMLQSGVDQEDKKVWPGRTKGTSLCGHVNLNRKCIRIREQLDTELLRYSESLLGVPIAYDNIKVVDKCSKVSEDTTETITEEAVEKPPKRKKKKKDLEPYEVEGNTAELVDAAAKEGTDLLIKKEEECYAEEQRIPNMTCHEVPYSGEKMSEILAQLKLEEIKGEREKQKQREKEYLRYVDALRAQIQEKMKLYNITLPPLCCCGPDFWDAHPETCANNCIFYKNHRAYTRALHSMISSCDIPEGHSTLQTAIHNFASVYRRTLKNL
ncbi:PREDICTED: coiled-coil domain-containing protein 15 [Chrysochloris asiatica]|uniref:Coiled-coil domain-containing protein 15 n=1 Tax=Chrysochloris asiatica TaxID=185453 RepID=A0A9B0TP71_CHRAS|nr:PREDICTED: coiled-coil domain-containing protein 15 [Chrysochloris asiatica]